MTLWCIPLREGAKPDPFLVTPASEDEPQFSPDGHYVACHSDESGRFEVYVRPFPTGDAKWTISTNGGAAPKWNPSGHELFFVEGETLMAVPVEIRPAFRHRHTYAGFGFWFLSLGILPSRRSRQVELTHFSE